MAELKDTHVVEIPVDEEQQQKLVNYAIESHPLSEICHSPGHLLLLKLWQREEEQFGRRIGVKESRIESIKSEIFQLGSFSLMLHGIFLTILFTSSVNSREENINRTCRKWWIPSVVWVSTWVVLVFMVQVKVMRFWKVKRQLEREKNDNRAVNRCIKELRMKGMSFDLSKEPQCGKRMKSSSVEIKWKPLSACFSHYFVTVSLLGFSGFIFPASKFILCGF